MPIEYVEYEENPGFWLRFVHAAEPVVVTGFVGGWKATDLWTRDYFRTHFGALAVNVSTSQTGVFQGDPDTGFSTVAQAMPMAAFLDALDSCADEGRARVYLQQMPLEGPFSSLLQHVCLPSHIANASRLWPHLWIGAAGNVSPLHFDSSHNFLAQVAGQKHLVLFAPGQTERLYPFPSTSRLPHVSMVDLAHVDRARFPNFAEAVRLELVLKEGEMLFIPVYWWHHVTSRTISISVNAWWKPQWLTARQHTEFVRARR